MTEVQIPRGTRDDKGGDATDDAVEQFLGRVLQWGVVLSASIAAVGGSLFYARHGLEPAAFRVFSGEPMQLRTIRGVVGGVVALRSRPVVQLGLLLLIATPVARVGLSLVAFAKQRDWLYVGITSVVLALLLASLLAA